eukprot:5113570-Prymnesium_polylepis.1
MLELRRRKLQRKPSEKALREAEAHARAAARRRSARQSAEARATQPMEARAAGGQRKVGERMGERALDLAKPPPPNLPPAGAP